MKYLNYLSSWIKNEVLKANAKGVVIGISGGIDSAVVAALAKKAFPENSLGVFLPVENMGQDLIDAKKVAENINIETTTVDLTKPYKAMTSVIELSSKLAMANIKPRLRMTALYALAQEKNYLVLGTDNAAEWILGYFTKYGDGGVDLLPIVNVTKGDVREMAKKLNLPNIVITKKPTAALWEGQTDEDELGFSYDEVDKYILGKNVSSEIKSKIEHQIKITEHKRVALPVPKKLFEI